MLKKEKINLFAARCRANKTAIAIIGAAALFSLIGCLTGGGSQIDALALWGLGAAIVISVFAGETRGESAVRRVRPAAWLALAASACLIWFAPAGCASVALTLLLVALMLFCVDWRLSLKLILPLAIFVMLAPAQKFIYILLSLPMSQLCAALTVSALRLVGVSAEFERAVISVGGGQVAVTAACSGVELLEAMLFIGFFFVNVKGRSLWLRVAHYLTLLPIIIICNTLRLTVVIWLYTRIGDRAFEDPLHSIFGLAVTAGAVLLLAAERPLFAFVAEREAHE
ncbi:MAG: exosortase/archaeosortase family protein [Victivallaceae bacterium]|nr:exosortase/archaeosortase family protein [Victivallaceae bacterium]